MNSRTVYPSPVAELGYRAGQADAAWVFDGNTPEPVYGACLRLDHDGDPAWWDHYGPAGPGPLAGEWADAPTPATLAAELDIDPDSSPDELHTACGDYEDAYLDGWRDALLSTASYHSAQPAAS